MLSCSVFRCCRLLESCCPYRTTLIILPSNDLQVAQTPSDFQKDKISHSIFLTRRFVSSFRPNRISQVYSVTISLQKVIIKDIALELKLSVNWSKEIAGVKSMYKNGSTQVKSNENGCEMLMRLGMRLV